MEVIQFLIVNELALRGNYILEEEKEQGLFQNLFEYTCMKDPNLNEVLTHIPQNATYRSPEIQNQIIQAMVQAVRSSIVKDINESDVKWFTLMEDGTRDKNNRENIALAIRYVKDGVVNESLLMVKTTENLDAATFTELTLNTLTENNIDPLVCLANAMMAQNIDENDEPFKSEYFETLDILIAELQRRFSDNDDLINSIASLDELDVDKMVPLKNLGLKIPSREEASVVKAYLSRNEDIMENTLQVLYRQREAFKDTYELLRLWRPWDVALQCESTFSTLTAINRPQRLSMGHERAGM
ncbi:hypothetical protein EVAR_84065_1, partial [Eumeta japonica]